MTPRERKIADDIVMSLITGGVWLIWVGVREGLRKWEGFRK